MTCRPSPPSIAPSASGAGCVRVCGHVLTQGSDGSLIVNADTALGCPGCAQCTTVCPTGSIIVTGRGLQPDDLVPLPPISAYAGAEQLDALLPARRSVRQFTDEPVSAESSVGVMAGWLRWARPPLLKLARPFIGKILYESATTFTVPALRLIVEQRRKSMDRLLYDAPAALLFHLSPYADAADSAIAAAYGIPAGNKPGLVLLLGHSSVHYRRAIRRRFASVTDSHNQEHAHAIQAI